MKFPLLSQWAKASCANILRQSIRYSSFRASPLVTEIDKSELPNHLRNKLDLNTLPNVKVEQNPAEWKYVEEILAPLIIPQPTVKSQYPSGWKPQTIDPKSTPYFIKRNRNHMVPVHLRITFRGTRRHTCIRGIQGDIWKLETELRVFLEDYLKKKMSMRVNEFNGELRILGDHVNLVKHFLTEKGF